jgi:hypothetical protein
MNPKRLGLPSIQRQSQAARAIRFLAACFTIGVWVAIGVLIDQPHVIWRFVAHDDEITRLIIKATCKTGGQVAHAEAIMRGGTIIGAFAEGGVQERRPDYDGGIFAFEQLIALPVTVEIQAKFEHYMRSPNVMGEKYDYFGLFDFVQLVGDWHQSHKAFCSTLITDAARWDNMIFKHALPIHAHGVSPVMLQQMTLCRDDAKIITRDDPIFIAHISAEKTGG